MTIQIESRPTFSAVGSLALHAGLIVAALLAVAPIGSAWAADAVVAKVQGVEIRESDLAMAEEDIGQAAQQMTGEAKRDYLIAYLGDVVLAAKAAEAKKIDSQTEFKSRMSFIRNKLLMETLLQDVGKAAVTDAEMKKVYDEAVKQSVNDQEVRARHILVPTEDEAKAVLAEVKKGTDFSELARQKSKDPGAAAEGGDLGYFTKEQMVPQFSEVAFKLEKGEVSDPVKTQFGWHVIKVEDKRTKPMPPFEQVKGQVENFVIQRAQAAYIAKLREGGKVERVGTK